MVVVAAPPWFVDDQSLDGLKAQNEVRTTLLQGLAGSVLIVGAYFTYRQLHTAREGQITERYTRAIDQLGDAQLDVRLGGIYALGADRPRLARRSGHDWGGPHRVRPQPCAMATAVFPASTSPPRQSAEYLGCNDAYRMYSLSLTVLGRGGFAPPKAAKTDLSCTRSI